MATTYNKVLVGELDITETYKKLMQASIGQDSVYLKAKETLNDYYATSAGLTDVQRATMLSQAIVDISKEITSQAMQMALKIDTENRDASYALTKLKEDTRLVTANIAKVEKDIELADKNLWITTVSGWKVQAEVYRDYGVQTWGQLDTQKVLPQAAYIDYGVKVETLKKAKADIYNTYAGSYRQNGKINYTTNINDGSFASVSADTNGLTHQQTMVAVRQEKAFEDNKKQHVVNSSASFMSTLLATETSGIEAELRTSLAKWTTAIDYLNTPTL